MCPALFTVGLLKKFLRLKYELKPPHKVIRTTIIYLCALYIEAWNQNGYLSILVRLKNLASLHESAS
jgi:hypothetical protein